MCSAPWPRTPRLGKTREDGRYIYSRRRKSCDNKRRGPRSKGKESPYSSQTPIVNQETRNNNKPRWHDASSNSPLQCEVACAQQSQGTLPSFIVRRRSPFSKPFLSPSASNVSPEPESPKGMTASARRLRRTQQAIAFAAS